MAKARLFFTLLGFTCVISAQTTTAELTGTIADASKAAVAGAALVVTNVETGAKRDTVSNDAGNYVVPLLPPGSYQVTVQKAGFRQVTRSGVILQVGQVARVDFTLDLGAVSDSVVVSASAPLLEQETSALGQVVDQRSVENLPLNGRSSFRLVQLTPGILAAPAANGQFGDIPVNTTFDSNFSINGGRSQSNEVLIDGVPSTAGFFNQITTIPSVESTREFRVQSNGLAAEYGRSGGGVLNVSTKSGTNELHGSAFEFLRNSAMDSNEFFNKRNGRAKPPFRMNQFGGSIGGPVWIPKLYKGLNKTFFFGDYQGTRWFRGDVFQTTVPTLAQRAGDFSQTFAANGQLIRIFDPLTTRTVAGALVRDQFAGNVIPANRIDPIARRLISYYPLPNAAGDPVTGVNNFFSNAGRRVDANAFSARVDHNVSDTYHLFARFSRNSSLLTQPDYFNNVASPDPGAVGSTPFRQHTFANDHTITLSPTLLLNFRYGFARWYQLRATRSYGFDQRTLGFPDSLVRQYQIPVFPSVTVETYAAEGNQSYLNNGNDTHSFLASLTKVAGKHSMKFGTDVRLRRINFFNVSGAGGTYNFPRAFTNGPNPNVTSITGGNGAASLLLGYGTGSASTQAGADLQDWYFGGYLQDDWKVTNRLTVNIGLRYETESPYTERYNQLVGFDTSIVSPVRNAAFPNLTGGLRFASKDDRYVYNWDKNNFAPRLGFAYTLTPKTVIRAGAGVFFAPLEISNNAVGFIPNSGYSASTPFIGSLDGNLTPFHTLSNPFPDGFVPPVRNTLGPATFLGQTISVWDTKSRTPYNMQWNFDVQRQLPGSLLVDVAYAGNRGVALTRARDLDALNPAYLSLGSALQTPLVNNPFYGQINVGTLAQTTVTQRQLLLPYPQFTGVNVINSTSGNSIYHSLQIKAVKQLSQGVSFLLAYTGEKLISDVNNQLSPIGPSNNSGVQNPYNLKAERSVSEMDIPKQLAFSFVAELPFGRGKRYLSGVHGVTDKLVSGWQINSIFTHRSGLPLTLSTTIVGGGNRPNSTGVSAALDGSRPHGVSIERWFDITQFTQPAPYTFGNVGRTLPDVRGPGMTDLDTSLVKKTALTEKVDLMFRAEAFNVLNTPFFYLPGTNLNDSTTFGKIRSTTGQPRVMQMALRLVF